MKKGLTDREKKPAADSPVTGLEDTIIHRAAAEKSRNKALAQHLRKTGQIASLSAEVSSVIEDFSSLSSRIARSLGTGKKALDKVNAETEAAVEFSGPMPESSQDVFQKVLGIMNALEYMSDLFGEHARSFTEILDDTNRAARVHSETQKSADELAKLAETGDSLIGSIENIAELLDVAGLNAALEAERSGEHSAGLSVIARRIQKTAADFEKTAGDFSNLVTDVKTRSGGAVEKIKALGDRIRTISVMTKGVKNAYDDLRADFTEICNRAVGLSDRANDAFPLNGDFSPGSETLLECSRRASALVDKAVLALETRESVFTAALRQSDSISSAASRLASGDNLIAALDDIINATDDFMGIAEETEDEQEAAVSILGDTAREMENMERSTEATGEILTVMARGAVDILDVSNNMNKKLDDIRKTIDNSGTALHGIAKELELLCTENRAFDQELRAFGLSIQQMVFFSGTLGTFSAKVDSISLYGELEITRTGQYESGFSAMAERLESYAVTISETVNAISGFSGSLGRKILDIASRGDDVNWDITSGMIEDILEDTTDIIDHELPAALENTSSIVTAAQKQVRHLDKTRERAKDINASSEAAANMVQEALKLAIDQMSILKRAFETGEKLQARADELYPVEEE